MPTRTPCTAAAVTYLSETETVLEVIFVTLLTATMCVGVQVLGGDFHPLELTYMYSSSPISLAL